MSTTETPAPLKGVKVIELGGFIAGPYAASLFAQFGADVIKVEPPGDGDPLRRWRRLHNGISGQRTTNWTYDDLLAFLTTRWRAAEQDAAVLARGRGETHSKK